MFVKERATAKALEIYLQVNFPSAIKLSLSFTKSWISFQYFLRISHRVHCWQRWKTLATDFTIFLRKIQAEGNDERIQSRENSSYCCYICPWRRYLVFFYMCQIATETVITKSMLGKNFHYLYFQGVDVQTCDLVVRFDKIETFQSYVQSKGRARAKDSKVIIHFNSSLFLFEWIFWTKKYPISSS